ncbi:DUF3617 domain-containing protein [Sphingomonas cavernae]|uniref:DUF3617 family protein n=1 Tax=Sphingomonas cavernae TaxID=2320861 RepID=A0A418W658_9SPHN|nr:hypothetical protein [Sphingomonas cavernae]RJF85438.1 hypothetical protein D3876_15975 [Sphingomonas cavernae]
MKRASLSRYSVLAVGALTAAAAPAAWQPARAPGLPALAGIEKGMWELRERGSSAAPRRICIADPSTLIQIRHGASACSRFVIDSKPDRATVHYTCPGAGHGRTTIRVETSRLIHIDSQGIADNSPFNFTYEGRRVGNCG